MTGWTAYQLEPDVTLKVRITRYKTNGLVLTCRPLGAEANVPRGGFNLLGLCPTGRMGHPVTFARSSTSANSSLPPQGRPPQLETLTQANLAGQHPEAKRIPPRWGERRDLDLSVGPRTAIPAVRDIVTDLVLGVNRLERVARPAPAANSFLNGTGSWLGSVVQTFVAAWLAGCSH